MLTLCSLILSALPPVTLQTKTDLQAFRYFSVLLLLLFAALLLRGGMTIGDFLAVAHGEPSSVSVFARSA